MRVLVVGSGGVGSAFVAIASRRPAFDHITVSDIDLAKAEAAVATAVDADDGRIAGGGGRRIGRAIGRCTRSQLWRRRDPQRLRSPFQPADLPRGVRGGVPLRRHGDAHERTAPDRAVRAHRPTARRRAVRPAPGLEEPRPDGARRHGRRTRLLRRRRPVRRRSPVLDDRGDRRPRRCRPRGRRVRLRTDVLDLDDDRGVPQPSGDLRT